MSEPKTFGQLATFTPIFDEVVVHFTEHPLMGRKHGDKRRKKFTISPLIVASVYGRVWRRCDNGAPDGRCWMGTRRIGKDLGISYRQAARALVALVEADYLIYCGVKETTGSNIYRIPQMADLVEVGHSATGVGHCDPGVGHSETEETSKDTSKETQRVVVVGLEKSESPIRTLRS